MGGLCGGLILGSLDSKPGSPEETSASLIGHWAQTDFTSQIFINDDTIYNFITWQGRKNSDYRYWSESCIKDR